MPFIMPERKKMKYKIIVDKQSRTNPTADKKIYEIEIEELRYKGNIHDSLTIEKGKAYVTRRLSLSELQVLSVLETPIIEEIGNINIELFEGDNYIYLQDMTGNKLYAEYIVKNDFTETYVTTNAMNSAINQSASQIELNVNQKLTKYSTTEEMNSAIKLKSDEISSEVNKKVGKTEIGTYIGQNAEAVKLAWNQISEFIQMMIIKNNASFAILDSNKKVMMALDKTGQHFYKSDGTTIFGEMGVNKEDSNSYISFAVDGEYSKDISDGMAWGIKTKSDNKFYPILYIKNFHMGAKQSDDIYGQLVLKYCDLILEGIGSGIQTGNVRIYGNELNGITFEDTQSGNNLMSVAPPNSQLDGQENGLIQILSSIMFYANSGGTNSFRIGLGDQYVLINDTGLVSVYKGDLLLGSEGNEVSFSLWVKSLAQIHGNLDVLGNVYANNISSDKRIKKNIKNSNICALDIIKQIKHKEFDKKDDGKHYKIGYIAQEMENIDSNFVMIRPKTEESEERYYINELPIIATATKAIQEQQEQIEELKEKDKQKDKTIQDLIKRIEKLEAK